MCLLCALLQGIYVHVAPRCQFDEIGDFAIKHVALLRQMSFDGRHELSIVSCCVVQNGLQVGGDAEHAERV